MKNIRNHLLDVCANRRARTSFARTTRQGRDAPALFAFAVLWRNLLTAIRLLIGVMFVCAETLFSQINYPMQTGNLWQYWESPNLSSRIEMRVMGDTLMPNGIAYRNLPTNNYGYTSTIWRFAYRVSGNQIYKYNQPFPEEVLQFDFSKKSGDTVSYFRTQTGAGADTSVVTVLDTGQRNIFGQLRPYKTFYERTLHATLYWIYEITDSIGMTFYQFEPGVQYAILGAIINGKKYGNISAVHDIGHQSLSFSLSQNYPNPFNPSTTIEYVLPFRDYVSVKIFDMLGREVILLANEFQVPGQHRLVWNGKTYEGHEVSGGVYFYQLHTSSHCETKKLVYLK